MYEEDNGVNSEEKKREIIKTMRVVKKKWSSMKMNLTVSIIINSIMKKGKYDYNRNSEDEYPTQGELKDFAYSYDDSEYSLDIEDGVIIIDFTSDEEVHTDDDAEQIRKKILSLQKT